MHGGDDPFVGEARGVVGLFHGLLGGAFEQAVAGLVPGQERGPQVGDRVPVAVICAVASLARRAASSSWSVVTPGGCGSRATSL